MMMVLAVLVPARMPFWLLMNLTRSTFRLAPSARMPAPLPSGTRARVSVRLRTVMLSPAVISRALPAQVLSVKTVEPSLPAPSMMMSCRVMTAQSKYSPASINRRSPAAAPAMAAARVLSGLSGPTGMVLANAAPDTTSRPKSQQSSGFRDMVPPGTWRSDDAARRSVAARAHCIVLRVIPKPIYRARPVKRYRDRIRHA